VILINMTVKTNESKDVLLSYADVLRDMIMKNFEDNYDGFVADTDLSELAL